MKTSLISNHIQSARQTVQLNCRLVERSPVITIHMPQKWNLSLSVKGIFRKTRTNRILVKHVCLQCNVFIVNFDAQCNQKLLILVIERN